MEMKFKNLVRTGVILTIGLLSSISFNAFAQPVPVDPAIRIGKLENGLTYYLRHNTEPAERASFYIIQNVGAMLENDDQDGLAHFLEHMAFNGTTNFPDKGIINTLERYGVAFGRNINAYTSQNETVYNLSDIPVKIPGLIDTCLLILHDWSDFLTLSEEEIDLERGVISEEWRTRRNASFRMRATTAPVLYKDSKYAVRDVIGSLDVIQNFDYATLRKFYHDWYRTDLQAIAVVGDIDLDEVEQKIVQLFSRIEPVSEAPERAFHEIPYHNETLFVQASDPEATGHSVAMYYKLPGTMPEGKDMNYYRSQLVYSLLNRMMNDRISELVQKGNPPFINGRVGAGGFVRGYNAFTISVNAHPNRMEEAFNAIYTEAHRALQHGFRLSELERARAGMLSQAETRWKQQDKVRNDQIIRTIVNHYLTGEPIPSPDFEWEYLQLVLPQITIDEVWSELKNMMGDKNRVIVVTGPESPNYQLLSEQQAFSVLQEVGKAVIEPYQEAELATSLINQTLKGAPVVSVRHIEAINAVEWTLANNARVVYRFADYQKDNVLLLATSKGGTSLYGPEKLAAAAMFGNYIGSFGVGDFDAVALRRMLAGKNVNLSPSLLGFSENISGSSTPRDFETLMELLYLHFEHPRFDEEAYQSVTSRLITSVANMAKNPQKLMSDSLLMLRTGYSERTKLITPELFEEFSLGQLEEIYRDRFADAGDFIFFIVGNIEEELVKQLAEKYIGSITDLPRTEEPGSTDASFPQGIITKQIPVVLQTEKANIVVMFNNDDAYLPAENLMAEVLRGILRIRYTEEIREKEGGTYGVGVSLQTQYFPRESKTLQMSFDTDPERAEYLKSILYREIDQLVAEGPSFDDFDKVVKNMAKEREQAKANNSYWLSVLNGYYLHNINNDDPANYEDVLAALTLTDLHSYAKRYFSNPNVIDVIFVPQK